MYKIKFILCICDFLSQRTVLNEVFLIGPQTVLFSKCLVYLQMLTTLMSFVIMKAYTTFK